MYQDVDRRETRQFGSNFDRTGRSALPLPKQVGYQAAPHPDASKPYNLAGTRLSPGLPADATLTVSRELRPNPASSYNSTSPRLGSGALSISLMVSGVRSRRTSLLVPTEWIRFRRITESTRTPPFSRLDGRWRRHGDAFVRERA